jgi:hypothetical protein
LGDCGRQTDAINRRAGRAADAAEIKYRWIHVDVRGRPEISFAAILAGYRIQSGERMPPP